MRITDVECDIAPVRLFVAQNRNQVLRIGEGVAEDQSAPAAIRDAVFVSFDLVRPVLRLHAVVTQAFQAVVVGTLGP